MAVAVFGDLRASEVTQLVGGDVHLDDERGVAKISVKRAVAALPSARRVADKKKADQQAATTAKKRGRNLGNRGD